MHQNRQQGITVVGLLGGVFALLLIAIIAAPAVLSTQVETFYREALQRIGARSSGVAIELRSFQRGWFRSTAEYVVRDLDDVNRLVVRDRVEHGPWFPDALLHGGDWLLLARTYGEITYQSRAPDTEFAAVVSERLKMDMMTTVGLQGRCLTQAVVQAVDSRNGGSDASPVVILDNVDVQADWDCQALDAVIDVHLPALYLRDGDHVVDIRDVKMHSEQREAAGLPVGFSRFDIGALLVAAQGSGTTIRDAFVSMDQRVNGDNFSATLDSGIGRLEVPAQALELGPASFRVSLRNLPAARIRDFEIPADAQSQGPLAALQYLPPLLSNSPEFEIEELSVTTTDGRLLGQGKASLPPVPAADLMNPFILMNSVQASGALEAPKTMVTAVAEYLRTEQLLAQKAAGEFPELSEAEVRTIAAEQSREELGLYEALGVLRTDAEKYFVDVNVSSGKVLVNGQPLSL